MVEAYENMSFACRMLERALIDDYGLILAPNI